MLLQAYNIIIGTVVIVPGRSREVTNGLIATDKIYLFQLMATVKIRVQMGMTHRW